MSTILKILVPTVPPRNADAYAFASALAPAEAESPPAPRLVQLHDALTERYPCWSSGAYAAAGRARCPWTDRPLITCFRGDMAIIGIAPDDPDVVPFVLRRAGALALTVIDQAAGKVYRPATFSVVFRGVQKNVNTNAMIGKLMPLLKMGREQVMRTLSTPNVMIKCRLDYVTAKRFSATMDLIGCDCTVEKELLVSAEGVATVMGFPAETAAPVEPAVAAAVAAVPTATVALARLAAIVPAPVDWPAPAVHAAPVPLVQEVAEAIKAFEAPPAPSAPPSAARSEPASAPQPRLRQPAVPATDAPMARFSIDEPDAAPRRGGRSLAPAWLLRLLGKSTSAP